MLPVVANTTVYNPVQTPLVNTAMPGSTIARVPYDNVAPSVSNAQINNNARGNSGVALPAEQPSVASTVAETIPVRLPVSSQNINFTAQATFLTQLAGGDLSPEAQSILIQYEKMIAFSNVKYKPSNATKPSPPPPGVFGRILQQSPARQVVNTPPVPTTAAQAATGAIRGDTAPVAKVQAAPEPRPARTEPARSAPKSSVSENVVPATQAISAYAAAARRGGSSSGNITDSV